MTTAPQADPGSVLSTAGALLFDEGDRVRDLPDLLRDPLRDVWRSLGAAGVDAATINGVVGELAAEIGDFIEINLVKAAIGAWTAWPAVREAAHRSVAPEPSTQTLVVGAHSLTCEHERQVDIFVADQRVATAPVQVTLEFTFEHSRITLCAGRLTRLHPGDATIALTLSVAGQTVKTLTQPLPLPQTIPLGPGVVVAHPPRTAETPRPRTATPDNHPAAPGPPSPPTP
jgi:hypothetical protein